MTVFRAATLRTFFFAFHAGAKELNLKQNISKPCYEIVTLFALKLFLTIFVDRSL